MSRIALLGPKLMTGPLAGAGIDVFPCDSTMQSRHTLADLSSRGEHGIIFMIERYARELAADIAAAEEKGSNIMLLPDHRGSIGLHQEALKRIIG